MLFLISYILQTTMEVTTTTVSCIDDADAACNLLTPNGGCYNSDTENSCCITCANIYNENATQNCR